MSSVLFFVTRPTSVLQFIFQDTLGHLGSSHSFLGSVSSLWRDSSLLTRLKETSFFYIIGCSERPITTNILQW